MHAEVEISEKGAMTSWVGYRIRPSGGNDPGVGQDDGSRGESSRRMPRRPECLASAARAGG